MKVCILPLAGSPGAILAGWATDRFFGGRRAPVIVVLLVAAGSLLHRLSLSSIRTTPGWWSLVVALVGFCTYGPHILMVGHAAQDFGKKSGAAGAAGFIDAMGYVGAALAGWGAGALIDAHGYEITFVTFGFAAIRRRAADLHSSGKSGRHDRAQRPSHVAIDCQRADDPWTHANESPSPWTTGARPGAHRLLGHLDGQRQAAGPFRLLHPGGAAASTSTSTSATSTGRSTSGPSPRCTRTAASKTTGACRGSASRWARASRPSVYQEVLDFPLNDAESVDEIRDYPKWPSPDWFDYDCVAEQVAEARRTGKVVVFMGDRMNRCAQLKPAMYLRGIDQILLDLALAPEIAEYIFQRITAFYLEYARRTFEAADGGIDIFMMGDDFGTQKGLFMSPDMWRRFLRPGFKAFIDLATAVRLQGRPPFLRLDQAHHPRPDRMRAGHPEPHPARRATTWTAGS